MSDEEQVIDQDEPQGPVAREPAPNGAPLENGSHVEDDQLEHLRALVVGPTAKTVSQLRDEIQNREVTADDVSQVLPSAIRQSAKTKEFSRALAPTLSKAFEDSVKKDPKGLADAIAPIMGPAIRRSITEQIRAMVQSLNTALDHSLSPRGIRWRIEAWQTGKPFAEVVLLHTLVYRIEQLLLIDPETGLLMQSVSADPTDDADLVSSLLSAIQDFMRDSFEHQSSDGSELQTLHTNELTLWIVHGSKAVLAAAVRGQPPMRLRKKLNEVLERIHIEHGMLLSNFKGDTTHLEIVQPDLEELLESEFVDKKPKAAEDSGQEDAAWQRHLAWAIPTVLLILALTWGLSSMRSRYRNHIADVLDLPPTAKIEVADSVLRITGSANHDWIQSARNRMDRLPEFETLDVSTLAVADQKWVLLLQALRNEAGIRVSSARRDGDRYRIEGWLDPLAGDPAAIIAQSGLDPASVSTVWEPYRAIDTRLDLRRLKKHLVFPPSLSAELDEATNTLTLKGTAKRAFLNKLQFAMSLQGTQFNLNISKLQFED